MAVGAAIGVAMGQHSRLDRLLDPWIILLINIPALVVIVLCYIWIGLTEAAALTAVALNKIPNVVVTLRSEEHTSELQSLMRISYAVFCLKKKTKIAETHTQLPQTQTTTHTSNLHTQ